MKKEEEGRWKKEEEEGQQEEAVKGNKVKGFVIYGRSFILALL